MAKKEMLSAHFSRDEMACRCCGKIGGYSENLKKLLICLERLRELVGGSLNVTSGYRCPGHNADVGGMPNSYHLKDMAADLSSPGYPLEKLAKLAQSAGFKGIVIEEDQGIVHCDIREIAYFEHRRV